MYISYRKLYYLLFMFVCYLCILTIFCKNYEKFIVKDLSNAVIRFHVRANSDSPQDQELKMKVKERIIDFLDENLGAANNTHDAAIFLENNTAQIVELATEVVHENGYDYSVTAGLGNSTFPDRYYGDVKLPAGSYNSYIVEIGTGEGQNWWCVLYPPLCFVDASTGVLPDESKETLKESISESEYEYVTEDANQEISFRFKYLTFLNELLD